MKKRRCPVILLVLLSFLQVTMRAQAKINGKITDKQSKQSLAFVSIIEKGTTNGTLTDIDGKFSLTLKTQDAQATLICSYLGYIRKEVEVSTSLNEEIKIQLQNEGVNLNEVVIKPGVNPALRIIRRVAANRDVNNPEKMHSFSYNSYNKMFVTADMNASEDSVKGYENTDTKSMGKFFAKQHLFLTESVSKRDYLIPGNNNEKVMASRVSGFKSAPFTLLATQMQSFSFYDDWVNVFDINYLNPISDIAISKYSYTIEDTLIENNNTDSVFIISFQPKKNKNFSGLKGVLYINTNTYAVQNVIAEPNAEDKQISIKIQQKYEFVEGKQWFPVQLNTDWIYKNLNVSDGGNSPSSNMKAVSRSYIREIQLNPVLSKRQFSEVAVSIDKNSDRQDESFWNQYRTDSLTKKDRETYRVVDSVGKKENFDKKAIAFEALLTGQIPIKFINVDINELMGYNDYEGYRLGLNGRTNHKVSDVFSIGGYFAYGFKDKAWKYGGSADVRIWKKKELKWDILYKNDVLETGGINFGEKFKGISNMEVLRNITVTMKDKYELMQTGFSFRTFKYFKVQPYVNHQTRISPVSYLTYKEGVAFEQDTFDINETGLKIKFLFKEKFMQTLRNKISLGSDFPVLYVNVVKGLKADFGSLKGNWDYTKAEIKMDYSYKVNTYGKENICIMAGKVFGDVPYTLQYNGFGNNLYKNFFGLAAEHCFETMYPNEFASKEFAALFFSHNFGKFLKPNKKFNPEIELVHNMGIGTNDNTGYLLNFPYKTMDRGFFESGLKLNCIIKSGISGIGLGAFYRYGPNAFSEPVQNLVVKFTLGVSIL
jgi:hypothetical protein